MVNITDYSNKQIGDGINLINNTVDTSTVLNVVGQGVNNYSQPVFENFMYLLSNFSNPYPPGSNFATNYQNNNDWVPSDDILQNTKINLSGQLWYQLPNLPILSQEIYKIVYILVNSSSSLTPDELNQYESQLLTVYQNSTSYQNNGYLWIMNSELSNKISPLNYNLNGIGTITVYDITQLGWIQVYPSDISSLDNVTIKNDTSGIINFYTSPNLNTVTSNITVDTGTDNIANSGALSINSKSLTINSPVTLASGGQSITTAITDNSTNIATTSFVNSYYHIASVADQGTPTSTNTCSIRSGFIEYLPSNYVRINLIVQYSSYNPVLIFPITMANTNYVVTANGADVTYDSNISFKETNKETTQMTFSIDFFNGDNTGSSGTGMFNVMITGIKSS